MEKNYFLTIIFILIASLSFGQTTNSSISKVHSDLTSSVSENYIAGFKMSPNPASNGLVNLYFKDVNEKHVEIYSLIGTHVLSAKIKSKESIDISNLSTGFYMVRVEDKGKIATRKLLIK